MSSVFSAEEVVIAEAEIMAALGRLYLRSAQVGSSYIVGHGKDLDIVVLVCGTEDEVPVHYQAGRRLVKAGYQSSSDGSGEGEDDFNCYRKGSVNVMLTARSHWFQNFLMASEVCKALRLTEKWQRVAVHRVIMDDEDAETATAFAKGRFA